MTMPEMPEPAVDWPKPMPLVEGGYVMAARYWTESQMRAYAEQCARAARAAAIRECEALCAAVEDGRLPTGEIVGGLAWECADAIRALLNKEDDK